MMTVIEPTRKDIAHPNHIKKNSSPLRLWHWLNTIIICGSLITVLINSTLITRETIAPVVQQELNKNGTNISAEQASGVGHALEDKVWEVHVYFGYCLAILLLFRLILEFFQLADQKFLRKIKLSYTQFMATKRSREIARHEFTVKLIYALFYLIIFVMVVTGLFLAFEDLMAPYKAIRHSVKEIHGFCMYIVLAFILVHLIGVFMAERNDSKGIVSDMIHGG
jgi:Ni/Fe-hydrogenase 1 B-type cytochrome subunit